MSGTVIDLTQTPFPNAVEILDYEVVVQQRKDALIAKDPALAAVLSMESEPLTKLLEEDTYRELLLRQHINDTVKATSLAHATGADLDALCAWRNIARLEIAPADTQAVPPTSAVMESDEALRQRYLLSFSAENTAGSAGSYAYFSLGADADVADVTVVSPSPAEVDVIVLSHGGTGVPSQALLDTVHAAVNAESVRPIGDRVSVLPATLITFQVEAILTLYPGPDGAVILQEAQYRLDTYLAEHSKLGHDITRSAILAALHVAGVQNVNLIQPAADVVVSDYEAARASNIIVSVGGVNV